MFLQYWNIWLHTVLVLNSSLSFICHSLTFYFKKCCACSVFSAICIYCWFFVTFYTWFHCEKKGQGQKACTWPHFPVMACTAQQKTHPRLHCALCILHTIPGQCMRLLPPRPPPLTPSPHLLCCLGLFFSKFISPARRQKPRLSKLTGIYI